MTDHIKDVGRAKEAQAILENPLVIEAFYTINQNLILKWETSKAADREGREEAWKMLHALNEFKRYFASIIQTGKVAKHELTLLDKFDQKVRSVFS